MNTNIDLSFVEKYEYPNLVREHFRQILSYIDPSKVDSVILTGSTSRGELSYKIDNGSVLIHSDYEFLIVAKGSVDYSDFRRLSNIYARLESEFSSIHLFHIDFSYITKKRLTTFPFHIKYFEMRETGKTIFGSDLLPSIRRVCLNNLDFKDLNEILIWRLWQILLYMPNGFLDAANFTLDQENVYRYVICRNFLDLVTWRLPFMGKLLAGFHNRSNYLQMNPSQWCSDAVIDDGFMSLLKESMIGKFEIKFSRSSKEVYTDVISYFIKAKETLSKDSGGRLFCTSKSVPNLFHDYYYRRKVREVLFVLKNFKQMGLLGGCCWILTKKIKLMLDFLCAMHEAAVDHINDNRIQAEKQLQLAESILRRLNLTLRKEELF